MKTPLSTHPETMHKLISRSLNLYRHIYIQTLLLAFILSVIVFLPRLILITFDHDIFKSTSFRWNQLWLILIDFLALTFFSALLWRIRCIIVDTHELISDDLKISLKKMPYILIAALLHSILIMAVHFIFSFFIMNLLAHMHLDFNLATTLLISLCIIIQSVVLIYIFFALYFYLPIILIENKGILFSLFKSARLVWGNWWRTFCVQLTPWIVFLLCLLLLQIVFKVNIHIYFFESLKPPSLFDALINIILLTLLIPWVGSTLLLQLHDLELRKKQEIVL